MFTPKATRLGWQDLALPRSRQLCSHLSYFDCHSRNKIARLWTHLNRSSPALFFLFFGSSFVLSPLFQLVNQRHMFLELAFKAGNWDLCPCHGLMEQINSNRDSNLLKKVKA